MQQRRVDRPAPRSTPRTVRSKIKPGLLVEAAGPAALGLVGEDVEPARDVGGRLLAPLVVRQKLGIERAGDRRLLDDAAVVARMQAVEDLADLPRLVDDGAKVRPGALLAGGERQHRLVEPALDQIILERRARPSGTAPTCRASPCRAAAARCRGARARSARGIWRKKKVRSSVRICAPSTSASVMMMILW